MTTPDYARGWADAIEADKPCFWCGTIPSEARQRYEGPHATWCPYFRHELRGIRALKPREGDGG